mmetsp:Transcript_17588/g.24285  ORF Transcript_17588/g.24285 Transcript_17588/m.24285 type:complete len:82 (-) Transcript_17588:31-276(-)
MQEEEKETLPELIQDPPKRSKLESAIDSDNSVLVMISFIPRGLLTQCSKELKESLNIVAQRSWIQSSENSQSSLEACATRV